MQNLVSSKAVATLFNLDHDQVLRNIRAGMGDRIYLKEGRGEVFLEAGTMAQLALWMNPSQMWLDYTKIMVSDALYWQWLGARCALDFLGTVIPHRLKTKEACLDALDRIGNFKADPLFSGAYADQATRDVVQQLYKVIAVQYAEFVQKEAPVYA